MSEFFHMGGFGSFIWSAMAVAAILMTIEPIALIAKRRMVLQQIKRNLRMQQRLDTQKSQSRDNN